MVGISPLLFSSSSFAQEVAPPPDVMGSISGIPYLIIGLMVAGGFAGAVIAAFVRKSNAAGQGSPSGTPGTSSGAGSKPSASPPAPMSGGFHLNEDFEEPTCMAIRRTDD